MLDMSQDKSTQDKPPSGPSDQSVAAKRSLAQPVDALRQGKVGQSAAGAPRPDAADPVTDKPSGAAQASPDTKSAEQSAKPSTQTDSQSSNSASSNKSNATSNSTIESSATSAKASSPMNKTTAASTAASTVASKKKNSFNGVWTGVGVGVVLVIAALIVGLWWQQQRFEAVAKEVATRLQQSDQQSAQASERATQALTLATAQREVVDQLRREQAVSAAELKVLQQAWEAANDGLDQTLLLNDLRRLISMANQELTLFGNVSSAIMILSSVRSMLSTQAAPALTNLQQAVITDLARLRSAPQVDVADLSAQLDGLIQLVSKAPLLTPQGQLISGVGAGVRAANGDQSGAGAAEAGDSAGSAQTTTAPWWQEATDTVTRWAQESSVVLAREFADVLSIRKADDPQALLLSEEQAIQLRANVRAMLLSAQLALMTRQPDIWTSELTEVRSLLNTRFDKENLDTRAALTMLDELLKAPLALDVPSIHGTLNALASADRALSIPDTPVDTGDAVEPPVDTEVETTTETVTDNTTETPAGTTEPNADPSANAGTEASKNAGGGDATGANNTDTSTGTNVGNTEQGS